MPTSAANDTVTLDEGPIFRVNSDGTQPWKNGLVIDGAGGADTVYVHEITTRSSYFSFSMGDDAIVSFTSASGGDSKAIKFANFETIDFWDKVLTLGSVGNDTLTGTPFADNIYGFKGNDSLDGSGGADSMFGGSGNDKYSVDSSGDLITELKGAGKDLVQSSVTRTLEVNVENLTLTGTGAINGTGNTAANKLIGNSGANILTGGLGKDKLTGGGGTDTFDFNGLKDSMSGLKHDVITDFLHGTDKIDLSGIDAVAGGSDNKFKFLEGANAAFHKVAGELHFVTAAGKTIIEGDVTGDGKADFQIELKGDIGLTGPISCCDGGFRRVSGGAGSSRIKASPFLQSQ